MKQIKLTKGQVALVDDEDFDRVNQFKWHAWWDKKLCSYYVRRNFWVIKNNKRKSITVLMHRFIMNVIDPKIKVDHQDHNTLNNQKYNLRVSTSAQNSRNRNGAQKNSKMGIRGISVSGKKFIAEVRTHDKRIFHRVFDTLEEAKIAVENARKQYFGEFAGNS